MLAIDFVLCCCHAHTGDVVFLQAFRKAIGVRIKEETEIIEGEVGVDTLLLLCCQQKFNMHSRAGCRAETLSWPTTMAR
jgi:hypothetical protein